MNGGGWKYFTLTHHHFKEGDVCVHEVHRDASQLKLLVHILVHNLKIFIVVFMAIKPNPYSYHKFCNIHIYLL
jgi:hypothetical protein